MKKLYQLLAVATFGLGIAQTNLVQNPGFENETLAPWAAGTPNSFTAPILSTTEFNSGTKSAGYESASATTGFYQNVAIEGGKEYTLKFWYKAKSNRSAGTSYGNIFRLWSVQKNSEGTPVYSTTDARQDPLRSNNGYLPLSADAWTEHTVTFVSVADATSIDVAFRVYGNGEAYVDDVSLISNSASTNEFAISKRSLVKSTVVSDVVTFVKDADVTITSVSGQVVRKASVKENSTVDLSSLPAGVYIVTGKVNGEQVAQKIIKK